MSGLRLAAEPEAFPVLRTNGPGLRYALWVQGCRLRCTRDCLNAELLPVSPANEVPVDRVVAHIERLRALLGIEGVTLLGGEPTEQPRALSRVAAAVRERGMSVVLYSGWRAEALFTRARREPTLRALLDQVDLLIDGAFVPALELPGALWRGSINQRLVFLGERYSPDQLRRCLRAESTEWDGRLRLAGSAGGFLHCSTHWAEHAPVPRDRRVGLPQAREVVRHGSRIRSWLPELAPAAAASLPSPKGIAAVVDRTGGLRLYGHQSPRVVDRLRRELVASGLSVHAA